jgi:uncharacterized protein (TIGR00290 family)
MRKNKTFLNWSSGKDAALACYYLKRNHRYDVSKLVIAINAEYQRVSMHGLRKSLLEEQLRSIGLPHQLISLPASPNMESYNACMQEGLNTLLQEGYTHSAFGDLFLEDLRAYREKQLAKCQLQGVFPLWKKDTTQLIEEFVEMGFKAIVVCVNTAVLDPSFAGRLVDKNFIAALPKGVDPCGENGEYHTFCFDGPLFNTPVAFHIGEKITKTYPDPAQKGKTIRFCFQDLLPVGTNSTTN